MRYQPPGAEARPLASSGVTSGEAEAIATELGIDFGRLGCDLEQFRMGLNVELEHGSRDPETDVSGNDPIVTGKIALAHLTEYPDYYTRLAILEREAAAHETERSARRPARLRRPFRRGRGLPRPGP